MSIFVTGGSGYISRPCKIINTCNCQLKLQFKIFKITINSTSALKIL